MHQFSIHSAATAPEASKALLQNSAKAYGFVPNLFAGMATSPALLEAYQALSVIFDKAALSETERQVIMMTSNRLNGCDYCMAAHSAVAGMRQVPADVIAALRNNSPIADAKLEALRQFSIKVFESRGWPQTADLEAFYAAGYTPQTVLEVILGTGMKLLSNYTNHVVQTPLDAVFAGAAWTTPEAA